MHKREPTSLIVPNPPPHFRRCSPPLKYCQNCSRRGHGFRSCSKPITSYGIIAFQRKKNNDLHFLLIQRKDSIGYLDLLRGRYMENAKGKNAMLQNIKILIEEMIPEEVERLKTKSFRELWDALWINHRCRAYVTDYKDAESKFAALDLSNLLANVECKWNKQEYGFPKGRRNGRETDLQCARREFEEETGLKSHDYTIVDDLEIQEVFTGSNGKNYRHIYYIAELKDNANVGIDKENITQMSEIRDVGLFSVKECLALFREYDLTKRSIVVQLHRRLNAMAAAAASSANASAPEKKKIPSPLPTVPVWKCKSFPSFVRSTTPSPPV